MAFSDRWSVVGPGGLEPPKRVAQLIYSQSPLPLGTRTHIIELLNAVLGIFRPAEFDTVFAFDSSGGDKIFFPILR